MTRAFVALPLPASMRQVLEEMQSALGVGRLVAPDNLHLTLAFLDDQPDAALADLHAELQGLSCAAVPLKIDGVDLFGGRQPRLAFAAVRPCPELLTLRKAVRGAARAVGIALPHERFRPHVTLARFRHYMPDGDAARLARFLEANAGTTLPSVVSDRFALMASELLPDGPRYELLAEYPLA